jgi:hypothetical protein
MPHEAQRSKLIFKYEKECPDTKYFEGRFQLNFSSAWANFSRTPATSALMQNSRWRKVGNFAWLPKLYGPPYPPTEAGHG